MFESRLSKLSEKCGIGWDLVLSNAIDEIVRKYFDGRNAALLNFKIK